MADSIEPLRVERVTSHGRERNLTQTYVHIYMYLHMYMSGHFWDCSEDTLDAKVNQVQYEHVLELFTVAAMSQYKLRSVSDLVQILIWTLFDRNYLCTYVCTWPSRPYEIQLQRRILYVLSEAIKLFCIWVDSKS